MDNLAAQLANSRDDYLKIQNQYAMASNRINEVIHAQRKAEAELEELDGVDDNQKVYKQIVRMFSQRSVGSLKHSIKDHLTELNEELPKLREIERGLDSRLKATQAACVEMESKLKMLSVSKSSSVEA